jgi:hypothetical protein
MFKHTLVDAIHNILHVESWICDYINSLIYPDFKIKTPFILACQNQLILASLNFEDIPTSTESTGEHAVALSIVLRMGHGHLVDLCLLLSQLSLVAE